VARQEDGMSDAMMSNFLYLKAVIHRYGDEKAGDLIALAERLVAQGQFPTRRAAITAIEESMGLPVTTPLSEEGATYVTRRDR
jgi:hypothetical protein